jgi:AraC-like DNA-binding protein
MTGARRPARTGDEATVRVGPAAAIPALLEKLGADPARVVAEAGLTLELFADRDNLMSYAARAHLLAVCAARTGCEHFGLLVGQASRLSDFGLVGYLVQHAPDVGTALHKLVRYLHLHVRGAAPTLTVEGNLATLGYEIHHPRTAATSQLADAAVAVAFNIMRAMCGPGWTPIEVQLAHHRPKELGPYRRFFGAPLRFDAERNGIIFLADWFSSRLPSADAELERLLQKQIDALESKHGEAFPEQVRRVLRTAILTGHATVEDVASMFCMHGRTLNRRLGAFHTNFKLLLEEVQFEVAQRMLEDTGMRVTEIAAAFDYADTSAFIRAFRRWSGTTPAAWRRQRGSAGALGVCAADAFWADDSR